jgi:hypothetical protein
LEVSEARRLKELEDENRRLKHMAADLSLDKEALKAVIRKNGLLLESIIWIVFIGLQKSHIKPV